MYVEGALWVLGAAVVVLVAYAFLTGDRDRPPES